MHQTNIALAALALLAAGMARADEPPAPFDGVWATVVACAASEGALPYTYEFPSTIARGVLHGERGLKGAPGWLRLDGHVALDGSAILAAHGRVGKEWAATGHLPPGTPYKYRIEARFSASAGTGSRVAGRACKVSFNKEPQ